MMDSKPIVTTDGLKPPRPIIVSTIHWYAVVAEPTADKRVAADLGQQGFDVFLAMMVERRRTANRAWTEITEFPLSPYVFVGIDDASPKKLNLKMVADTLGVSGIVSLTPDGSPSTILAEIIRRMRVDLLIWVDEATRRVRRNESIFHDGDEVEIRPESPFGGYCGKVKLRKGSLYLELPNGFPVRVEESELIPIAWTKKRAAGQ